MQINLDDIMFFGEYYAHGVAEFLYNKEVKSHSKISGEVISKAKDKFSWENILKSEHGVTILQAFIRGSIAEYHDQLREKLLEVSVDIGEIDEETPGKLKAALKIEDGDED